MAVGPVALGVSAMALAAGVVSPSPSPVARRDVGVSTARVEVRILRAVVVRQARGPLDLGPDAPQFQITRRQGEVLIEFQ